VSFEVYQATDGMWHWSYVLPDGARVEPPPQGLVSQQAVYEAIAEFKQVVSRSETSPVERPQKQPAERTTVFGWSAKDIAQPIILGLITFLGGALGAYLTLTGTRLTAQANERTAAAQILFSGNPTYAEILSRESVVAQLYPDLNLPTEGDDPKFIWPTSELKRLYFLQEAVPKAQCVDQLIEIWDQLFGPNRTLETGRTEGITKFAVSPCPSPAAPPSTPAASGGG
jgi:hypothetical protein